MADIQIYLRKIDRIIERWVDSDRDKYLDKARKQQKKRWIDNGRKNPVCKEKQFS